MKFIVIGTFLTNSIIINESHQLLYVTILFLRMIFYRAIKVKSLEINYFIYVTDYYKNT